MVPIAPHTLFAASSNLSSGNSVQKNSFEWNNNKTLITIEHAIEQMRVVKNNSYETDENYKLHGVQTRCRDYLDKQVGAAFCTHLL